MILEASRPNTAGTFIAVLQSIHATASLTRRKCGQKIESEDF